MEEQAIMSDVSQVKDSQPQPVVYNKDELSALRAFVELIKKDETRVALACWGDHSDYSHGY